MAKYIETFASKMDWAKPFQRTGQIPLDRSTMFESYEDAVKYAAGKADDPDSRGLQGTSYVGQIITVFADDAVNAYIIKADRSLEEVGAATEGDGKSIVLDNKILALYGFENAKAGQQLRIAADGKLEWFTPDTSTMEGVQAAIGALQKTVDGEVDLETGDVTTKGLVHKVADLDTAKANKTDVYTKEEVDGKLTGALHYKGSYDTFAELVAAVEAGTITPAIGDVYNITKAGGKDASGVDIKAGDNVIFNGTGWDVSAGTMDLSAYYTKDQADTELAKKVDKVDGSRLMTDAEGKRLAEVSKVEASKTNGNIKLEGKETIVYTLPQATDAVMGGVKGSAETDKIAVAEDGTMDINKVSAAKIDGVVAEAAKVTNKITIGTKTFDGSAAVTITADDVPVPENVVRKTDIATETAVGVVKGSADKDAVAVDKDGKMTLNTVSADKVEGVISEAAKVTNKLTFGTKTFDGSEAAEVTAEDLGAMKTADMDVYVKFENLATADKAGVVKSATTQDKVAVGEDGTMTVNDISASKVKGTVDKAADAEKLGGIASGDILVTDGAGKVKAAAAADKLATAQDISVSGDVTGTVSFDGSKAVDLATELKDVGKAGTYVKVTTDAKGRVTAGETALVADDIPDLTLAKITDAKTLAGKDKVARADLDDALTKNITDLEGTSHTHENAAVLTGITATKVSGWDHASEKIDGKADRATTIAGYGITDAYTKEQIDGKLTGALHYKSTYETFAALVAAVEAGTITPETGDVYNITNAGGEDASGVAIKAGDNVIYNGTGWDCSSGTMDLSGYKTAEQVDEALKLKAEKTTVDNINERLSKAETTIGDATSGLVKAVAANTTRGEDHETRIGSLETAVGNAESGLTKAVADNTAAIKTLNGDENTEGSVKKLIAASAADLNTAITEITKENGTIDTKVKAAVDAHNTAEDAHADLFAAKQNKVIAATVTFDIADFVENEANDAEFKATKTITGLDAAKNYAPSITPDITSCKAVSAAVFYPTAEVSNGALTLYCKHAPTAAIVVSGTFTEVQ